MEIPYIISPAPAILENMIAIVYETDSGAEVDRIVIPERDGAGVPTPGAGHQVPYTVNFTGRDRRPHIVRLVKASGGPVLHFYNTQPKENIVTLFDPIFFKIGDGKPNTPALGDSVYSNPDLAGATAEDLVILRSGESIYPEQDYEIDVLGGFGLVEPGDVFGENEDVIIIRKPKVATNPVHDSVVGKQFGGNATIDTIYLDVVSSVDYLPEHLRHLIRLSGSGEYHFVGTIPFGYPIWFTNMVGGSPKIFFDNAPLIQPGGNVTELTLEEGAIVAVVFDGTFWNLIINSGTPTAAYKIVHQGEVVIGNVGAGPNAITAQDSRVNILIPHQGSTSFKVRGSLYGLSTDSNNDNDVTWCYKIINAYTIQASFRKHVVQATNIRFDFSIEKAV